MNQFLYVVFVLGVGFVVPAYLRHLYNYPRKTVFFTLGFLLYPFLCANQAWARNVLRRFDYV